MKRLLYPIRHQTRLRQRPAHGKRKRRGRVEASSLSSRFLRDERLYRLTDLQKSTRAPLRAPRFSYSTQHPNNSASRRASLVLALLLAAPPQLAVVAPKTESAVLDEVQDMASLASPPPAASSLLPAFNISAASSALSPSHLQSASPAPPAGSFSPSVDSSAEQPRAAPSPVVPSAEQSPAADEQEDASMDDEEQAMVEDGDVDADALNLDASAPAAAARAPSAADKGKGVQRDEAPSLSKEEQDKVDEAERQKIIDKVLKRSEVVKTTRDFMNRLALAAFKAQRGWQDVALDAIEQHLEQEVIKRKEQEQQSHEIYHSQQHQQVYQNPTPSPAPAPFVPPPPNTSVMRSGPGLLYDQNQYQQQMQQSGYISTAFAPYPPGAHTFIIDPPTQDTRKRRHPEDSIGDAEPSPPVPRPPPSSSSNAQASRPQPRTNGSSSRSANGAPLSTADPGFSSFVDAAAALTGLSRAPSDPSTHSGEEGDDAPPRAEGQERPSQPNGNGEAVERPRTPEAGAKRLLERTGAGGTGGESSAEGAAELMLFLAASPSPVQVRTGAVRPALGEGMEGMGMKGRRLFSGAAGAGGDDSSAPPTQSSSVQSIFSEHLSGHSPHPPHSGLAASTYTEESNLDPSKSSHHYSTSASSHQLPPPPPAANSASALGNGLPPVPGTPTRDRQPSGSNWESYLNVSPSPQRVTVDRSEAAVAARQAERGPPPVFGMPMTSLPPNSLPLGRNGGAQGDGENDRW